MIKTFFLSTLTYLCFFFQPLRFREFLTLLNQLPMWNEHKCNVNQFSNCGSIHHLKLHDNPCYFQICVSMWSVTLLSWCLNTYLGSHNRYLEAGLPSNRHLEWWRDVQLGGGIKVNHLLCPSKGKTPKREVCFFSWIILT